jgi:hypothetical protein
LCYFDEKEETESIAKEKVDALTEQIEAKET